MVIISRLNRHASYVVWELLLIVGTFLLSIDKHVRGAAALYLMAVLSVPVINKEPDGVSVAATIDRTSLEVKGVAGLLIRLDDDTDDTDDDGQTDVREQHRVVTWEPACTTR